MTAYSTSVRATHLLTNAAWFGGSLMGAVALNQAAAEGDSRSERADIAGTGWRAWAPVQTGAIALHLLSGLAIVADNRKRTLVHAPTRNAVILKTTLTGVALASTAAAYRTGEALGEAESASGDTPTTNTTKAAVATLRQRMAWLRWATPAATAGLLVLDAYLGEQQRGAAGLLDRASSLVRRQR